MLYKSVMENFKNKYNVSRETLKKISNFITVLKEWQSKMNLVSPQSINEIWTRHIADSYQLFQFINIDTKTVYDIGSGAGFPAIILAIAAQCANYETRFSLIESITKKTVYLNDVKEKLSLKNVDIYNARSESLKLKPADIITARAVAALDKLFELSYTLANKKTVFYFLKGQSYKEELEQAKKHWHFKTEVIQSSTSENGVILKITELEKKKGRKK